MDKNKEKKLNKITGILVSVFLILALIIYSVPAYAGSGKPDLVVQKANYESFSLPDGTIYWSFSITIKNIGTASAYLPGDPDGFATIIYKNNVAKTNEIAATFCGIPQVIEGGESYTFTDVITEQDVDLKNIKSVIILTDVNNLVDESNETNNDLVKIIPNITVLSPNGGERWQVGSKHKISWSADGLAFVSLAIADYSSGEVITIKNRVRAELGYYYWTIPNSFKPDSLYMIRVWDGQKYLDNAIIDESDYYFEIIGDKPLAVLSPNGGERWQIGGTYQIEWNKGRYGDKILIALWSSEWDADVPIVITETANTGYYSWTIPYSLLGTTITPGRNYKIYIESGNGLENDWSNNYFSIIKPATRNTRTTNSPVPALIPYDKSQKLKR